MKEKRQAEVVVLVLVEGQEAMRGQALIPGYKRGSVSDDVVQGTLRSAALRSIAQSTLVNSHEVWDHLHSIHQVNEEQRLLEEGDMEASAELEALRGTAEE